MDNNNHIPLRTIESTPSLDNLDRICDMEEGRLSGKVFWDQAIYEQELEKIFARCWLFVAHESQLPKFGDYLTTSMGEDEVLVVRQKDASLKVFLNACPHRGNKVCFAEAGNARGFICNYHGWSFGADGGRLMGMPSPGATKKATSTNRSTVCAKPVSPPTKAWSSPPSPPTHRPWRNTSGR